jgi:hypothetical protein
MTTDTRPLVIIPCGGKKRDVSKTRADRLYVGPYFRACLDYAETLTSAERIYILSALHGLIRRDKVIGPYDVKMGDHNSVPLAVVASDAIELDLVDEPRVIALGGRAYTSVVKKVWPHAETPLDGVGGLGMQLRWMKEQTRHA